MEPEPESAVVESLPGVGPFELRFDRRRVLRTLLVACVLIEIAFAGLDYFINYSRAIDVDHIRRMFNNTREDSLASWFSITQTLLVALTVWGIWCITRHRGGTWPKKLGWLVVALFFTYMAFDDGAKIHERLGSTLKDAQQGGTLQGFPSYFWQIIFVPFFAVMGVYLMVFLWRQPDTRRLSWVVALALGCMAFAVGLDFVEGMKPDHPWNVQRMIADQFSFGGFTRRHFQVSERTALMHFSKSLEETIEAFAMSLLWLVFLSHLMRLAADVRLRFEGPRA